MPSRVRDITAQERPSRTRTTGALRSLTHDENRRSFLRMVSHELRTPLNSVIGFSEIMSRELYGPLGDPRYKDHAELINQSGERLLKLVNDVIDLARLEAGAMDLDIRPESSGAVIEDVLRALRPGAAQRGVDIVHEGPEEDPLVLVDQGGFQRVLANLVQNAVTHSPPGGEVALKVRIDGRKAAFDVVDGGRGRPPEDLERLVNPYGGAENALVRRTEGAGLGLAIVALLTRSMHGRFSVASAADAGLTATVAFRLAPPPSEDKVRPIR